jgi:hypothetical protein
MVASDVAPVQEALLRTAPQGPFGAKTGQRWGAHVAMPTGKGR